MEDFDLLPEIPIDRAHTLDQLTARFATVRDGLPELIKNAKDQYSRLGIYDRNDRQIVVVADTERKSLMLLDFAGAASEDFAGWTTWSSRTANRADRSPDIEGGHGNGGKAFMVRGSAAYAYMESCANGRRTKMGFRNDKRAECYKPGYAKDRGVRIDDVLDPSPTKRLSSALSTVGIKLNDIPDPARAVFERRNRFTAVVVHGILEWEHKRESTVARLANELPQLIGDHGQAALTVETCDVWVVVDGVVITSEPLRPR